MAALTVNREMALIHERTTRLAVLSVILHAIAGYFVLTMEPITHEDPLADCLITEITWLQPEPIAVAKVETKPATPTPPPAETVVQESQPVAPADPGLSARAIGDILAAQRTPRPAGRSIAEAAGANLNVRPSSVMATLASGAGREAVEMSRERRTGRTSATARRTIHREAADVASIGAAIAAPSSAVEESDLASREISPGISLAGPVTGRTLLSYDTPTYPEWARQDGVEVTVELVFTVLPNGRVKENVRVKRSSGYVDFDQRAKSSLRTWRFENLDAGATNEQWGRIEFNYRLKQAG